MSSQRFCVEALLLGILILTASTVRKTFGQTNRTVPSSQLSTSSSPMPDCPGKSYGQVLQAFAADHVQPFSTSPESAAEWSKVCGGSPSTKSSFGGQARRNDSGYKEIPGSYYKGPTWTGDPCDWSDLIATLRQIENRRSLAAIDTRQNIEHEINARMAACIASANDSKDKSIPIGGLADNSDGLTLQTEAADSEQDDLAVGKEMKEEVDHFAGDIKELFTSLKEQENMIEPLQKTLEALGDSFEAAGTAASGETPGGTFEKTKEEVEKRAEALNELAHKDPVYWLAFSGVTDDPSSVAAAQQRLDDLDTNLANIQLATEQLVPAVNSLETTLNHPAVQAVKLFSEPTTEELDPIALDWIASQLSGSSKSITDIRSNIRRARGALQSGQ